MVMGTPFAAAMRRSQDQQRKAIAEAHASDDVFARTAGDGRCTWRGTSLSTAKRRAAEDDYDDRPAAQCVVRSCPRRRRAEEEKDAYDDRTLRGKLSLCGALLLQPTRIQRCGMYYARLVPASCDIANIESVRQQTPVEPATRFDRRAGEPLMGQCGGKSMSRNAISTLAVHSGGGKDAMSKKRQALKRLTARLFPGHPIGRIHRLGRLPKGRTAPRRIRNSRPPPATSGSREHVKSGPPSSNAAWLMDERRGGSVSDCLDEG